MAFPPLFFSFIVTPLFFRDSEHRQYPRQRLDLLFIELSCFPNDADDHPIGSCRLMEIVITLHQILFKLAKILLRGR